MNSQQLKCKLDEQWNNGSLISPNKQIKWNVTPKGELQYKFGHHKLWRDLEKFYPGKN